MSCRYAAQSCARHLRSAHAARAPTQLVRISAASRRWNSTDAAPANPKIEAIVDQISQLTLLETADLVSSLKVSEDNHLALIEPWRGYFVAVSLLTGTFQ